MDLVLMVLLWGSVGVLVLLLRTRRRPAIDLRESFAGARFPTPTGELGGNAVRVVRIERQGLHANIDPFDVPAGMLLLAESFWYCVAPGPAYFVAIPTVERGPRGFLVKWVVRSLSEGQLRSALAADPAALAAALADAPPPAGDVRYRMQNGVPRPAPGASAWPTPPVPAAGADARTGASPRGLALLGGVAVAVLTVPPVLGFYWGWNTPGQFDPWLHALGQAFMSWVIYLHAIGDGELLHTAQGRSVALAFVAVAALFAWIFLPARQPADTRAAEPPR